MNGVFWLRCLGELKCINLFCYKIASQQNTYTVCNVHSISLNENTVITTAERLSMRAHHTGELLLCSIWWTWKSRTNGFHMIEVSTIAILTIKSRNRLRIFVNTFISGTMMIEILSHQVSSVLCGPVCGAVDFSWNHQQCSPFCDMTHCTRNIVVINALQWLR